MENEPGDEDEEQQTKMEMKETFDEKKNIYKIKKKLYNIVSCISVGVGEVENISSIKSVPFSWPISREFLRFFLEKWVCTVVSIA